MESVMEKIRQAREDKNAVRTESHIKEIVVDGCQVKMTFNPAGDSKAMAAIRSMLMSAHTDTLLSAPTGGEWQ